MKYSDLTHSATGAATTNESDVQDSYRDEWCQNIWSHWDCEGPMFMFDLTSKSGSEHYFSSVKSGSKATTFVIKAFSDFR